MEDRVKVDVNSQRTKKILEGYEDAPAFYKILRVVVYESVGKTRMDIAHIEKILGEKVKEMLKAGKIDVKTYRKIQKIAHRQQRRQLEH